MQVISNPLEQSELTYVYLTPEQARLLSDQLKLLKAGDAPLLVKAKSGDIQIQIAPAQQ